MRRHDKEISDKEDIEEILKKSEICRLGLVENDEAYIIPVNFAYSDGKLYIHSAPQGRKIQILSENKHITFEMELIHRLVKSEIACGWTEHFRSLMGRGVAEIVTDPALKTKGLNLIMRKYGFEGELKYEAGPLSRMILIVINILSVTAKKSG